MKLKRWEIALAAALLVSLLMCAFPADAQQALAQKMVRLHILAASDTLEDQHVKLQVRDAVLAASAQSDGAVTPGLLRRLQSAARQAMDQAGCDDRVTVCRESVYFDTREYDGFSLPAGEYDAVRVIIGSGEGHNWWCVLYPPLCAGVCEDDLAHVAKNAGLTEDEINLICENGQSYVLRFRLAELWGKLLHCLRGKA